MSSALSLVPRQRGPILVEDRQFFSGGQLDAGGFGHSLAGHPTFARNVFAAAGGFRGAAGDRQGQKENEYQTKL